MSRTKIALALLALTILAIIGLRMRNDPTKEDVPGAGHAASIQAPVLAAPSLSKWHVNQVSNMSTEEKARFEDSLNNGPLSSLQQNRITISDFFSWDEKLQEMALKRWRDQISSDAASPDNRPITKEDRRKPFNLDGIEDAADNKPPVKEPTAK